MDRGACQGHKELDMTERLNHHHTAHAFPNNRKEQSELKSEVRRQLHLLYCGLSSSGRSPKQQNIHKTDTQTQAHTPRRFAFSEIKGFKGQLLKTIGLEKGSGSFELVKE